MHPSLGLRSKSRVWAHEDSEPSGTTHGCLGLTYVASMERAGVYSPGSSVRVRPLYRDDMKR
jgi:hypothetical protein